MTESFCNLEDEPFPSFLSASLDGSRATLGNVTLGSTLGLPVAASTVAKIRAGASADNRVNAIEASYLEGGQLSLTNSESSNGEKGKFALSFKDDLDDADDFIAAHRVSDMLVKVQLDETGPRTTASMLGPSSQTDCLPGRPSEHCNDLSTGLLTFTHLKDTINGKALPFPAMEGDSPASDGGDSDCCNGSVSSFLANEKLMSVDSDVTDDDLDLNHLNDDEMELYFNKVVPPAMQRGQVEGQEIPAAENFQMPDVRLAATGMDSCPASDEEDTEDELEAARRHSSSRPRLLPSTSRQLVGESNRPSFRPGLEGGSSDDDESFSGRNAPSLSGIEHRRSAEGQVINSPVTGDGGGGDGSSGSEDSGNDGGVSTIPLPVQTGVQTTYDVLRGLGIVGSSGEGAEPSNELFNLPGLGRNVLPRHSEMGDRVGPVGTGEASSSAVASGPQSISPVNWSMTLDRQEALNAMDSAESEPSAEAMLDSVYLRAGAGHWRPQDLSTTAHLQGTQGSFHLSQVLPPDCDDEEEEEEEDDEGGVDEVDGGRPSLGLRGGPCGDATCLPEPLDSQSEEEEEEEEKEEEVAPFTSLEDKYLSQSFHQEDSDDGWNHCPDNMELEFQQGANATHSVVYQNEEGKWVTDLAYYSSFEKELEGTMPEEVVDQFQTEEFVPASNAIDKIIEDQEEFEKEHQFMQEEQIEAASCSPGLADTSWKVPPSGPILMRASQVSSEFDRGNQSYLRLSLGEFFEQRSEALGSLGDNQDDGVKRPSFGYFITSPEKREPFALIHPSDFASRDCSVHNETVQINDADHTMNADDLDKTLEALTDRMSPKGNADPEPCERDQAVPAHVPQGSGLMGSGLSDQSCLSSPRNASDLMLSISTIASAIADASISSDPAQLAAMIMELSKRSRAKARSSSSSSRPGPGTANPLEEPTQIHADQSPLVDTLQNSTSVCEVSAFDMEKYLKKTEVPGSSDSETLLTPPSFDMLGWGAEVPYNSLRDSQAAFPPAEDWSSAPGEGPSTTESPSSGKGDSSVGAETKACNNSTATPLPGSSQGTVGLPGNKRDSGRRSIPCPKASSVPISPANPIGSIAKPGADGKASDRSKTDQKSAGVAGRNGTESGEVKLGTVRPQLSNPAAGGPQETPAGPRPSPGLRKGHSGLPGPRGSSSVSQQAIPSTTSERILPGCPSAPPSNMEKHVGFACHSPQPAQCTYGLFKGFPEQASAGVEESQCTFRPSTSPLTHSSPSQTSFPSADRTVTSPSSSGGMTDGRPCEMSPQSTCSSPSLSRLTYISMNDSTCLPTPDRHKSTGTMLLSTTIIRASPTPPEEQETQTGQDPSSNRLGGDDFRPSSLALPHQSKSPEPQYDASKSPDLRSGSALGCTRSRSESNFHCGTNNLGPGYGHHKRHSEPGLPQLTKVDSGYSSNLNIQQPPSMASQASRQWAGISASGSEAFPVFGLPPSYSSEDLCYIPISSFKPQGALDLPHGGIPTLLTGRSLFSSHLAQQYLGTEGALHPGSNHMGPGGGLYGVSAAGMPAAEPLMRHCLQGSGGLGIPGHGVLPAGYPLYSHHPSQLERGMLEKPYSQQGGSSWSAGGLPEFGAQVVVPEELRFPHACCVGIASQTSLSLFNPSDRWQQVSISLTSLSINGEKVDSLPYQWLIIKNKTIIGPRSTEEQKVLFIPPQAGVYQCVLSVSSWPTSAEADTATRAEVFAKRVVLIAMAENPALEIDVGKCGSLDFGDLAGGSAKSLALKLTNRTHATVPIRLVISANATAWRCFTFSKSPVAMTAEGSLHAGRETPLAAPSVMNHVLHASYGENPESFMVWVHFHAPQRYTSCSGELGPADEFSARVDVELDCPGPSHVIRSIPLKARSGTARVHAPKDLQTVCLSALLGQSKQVTLPLKNAGNIDVQLKLKSADGEDCFSVKPEELSLHAGQEQGIVVSFTAQGSRKYRESVLTIQVLPSGPQYEVALKGELLQEDAGKTASAMGALSNEVPPILSNKQFIAWGGVTLGRAVQQKLVLRNNSLDTTQHLRLLIRGQDQDCFQLQSTFGPEERLTRHRELSIRPREDMTVHLLFAPTRVACMLAKLEIKQSGVRPSQPGVKFTIPLSGYGGTSNIILEDLRKRSDGYVALLPGVSAGRVSKVCVCVRNTGSRAAYIKAVTYSDLQTHAVMDPAVISLSPSQFVLKERTQEVITVLLKSRQKEQAQCQSTNALLATVCLFCGDEVSRQQFRRLLLSKPEAGKKVLSENSLLKGLDFNNKFLGEEMVQEAYDLPQRPNEAQIFFANMSKVVLSLLGSVETSDSGESDHIETLRPSTRQGSESDSGFGTSDRHISNVSLDVLPVKGPQGPALRVGEPSLKGPQGPALRVGEPSLKEPSDGQRTWSLQPEQLVLSAPTINGAANTRHVQIQNHSSRELSFELSWPAHCLTITPQHGLIEPECHLQILISPNPSLATKSSLLPWRGQVYVQCDNQQKFIKVQIRRDLALDVSAVPGDKSLSALPPQAATPLAPPIQSQTKPPQAQVEITNRTIVFPATGSGETSESSLEVENGQEEVRWYLSSFAPPYVKGVDKSGDVYRATYTAFRCSRVSGILGAKEKMQVPVTFLPRDRGDYAQFWDLECHSIADPQHKTQIRFQFCGTGVKGGPVEVPQEADCSLVRTEVTVKTKKRPDSTTVKTGQEQTPRRGVYAPQDLYTFPATRVGESSTLKVNFRNNSFETHELRFVNPSEPFHIKHSKYSLRSQHYINLPVQFKPGTAGKHASLLLIQSETSGSLTIQLTGEALP